MENGQVSNNSITRNAATESMIDESDSTLPEPESHQRLALDYSSKMENKTRRKRYLQRIKAQKSFFLALLFLTSVVVAPQLMQLNDEAKYNPTARGSEWGCMDDGTYFWETNETTSIGPYKDFIEYYNESYTGNMHAPYPDIFYNTTDDFFVWRMSIDRDWEGRYSPTLNSLIPYQWPESTMVVVSVSTAPELKDIPQNLSEVLLNDSIPKSSRIGNLIFNMDEPIVDGFRADDYAGYRQIVNAYCDGVFRGYTHRWFQDRPYFGLPPDIYDANLELI